MSATQIELMLAQQAQQQPPIPAPKLTPEQQQALLIALVADVAGLRSDFARLQKMLVLLLGILIGTFGAEKILALISGVSP